MYTYLFDEIVEAVETRIFTPWRTNGGHGIRSGRKVASFGTKMGRWSHQHDDGDQEKGEGRF